MALYWNEKTNGRVLYDTGVEYVDWAAVITIPYASDAGVEILASNIYGYLRKGAYGDLAEAFVSVDVDVTGCAGLKVTFKVWSFDMVSYTAFRAYVGATGENVPPVGTAEPDYQTITVDISTLSGTQTIKVGMWDDDVYLRMAYYRIQKIELVGPSNELHRVR